MSGRGTRRWSVVLATLLVAFTLTAAGCGNKSSSSASGGAGSSQVHHAKTKFILHAGLAFGAFHHFIYKPAKAGDFSHPFSHKFKLLEAAVAGAFVIHELKLALHDAQADPTLSKLVAPLTALGTKLSGVVSGMRHGNLDTSGLTDSNNAIGSISQAASTAGQPITEQVPSHP